MVNKNTKYMQVESPYRTCPFKCEFCCSSFEGTNPFGDYSLFEDDKVKYVVDVMDIIRKHKIKELLVTGMTEPTLFQDFVYTMLVIADTLGVQSTIQTMNHKFTGFYGNLSYDVVAYSMKNNEQMLKPPVAPESITRYVVIYSNMIDDNVLIDFSKDSISKGRQVTVKFMAKTSNGHKSVDEWIDNNDKKMSKKVKDELQRLGVWVDDDCMNVREEKPMILLRKDGKLYNGWLSKESMED